MTRRPVFLLLVLLAGLALVASGCGRYLTTGVAVVNGESVSKSEFDRRVASALSDQQQQGVVDPSNAEARRQVERQVILQLIQQLLVRQEGDRLKLSVKGSEIDQSLAQVRSQFPDEAAFQQALKSQGFTLATLRKAIGDQVLLQAIQARVTSSVKATEEEIRAAYGNGQAFQEIHVRHILFQVSATNQAAQRAKAQATLARLRAGEDFATLAKQLSEDLGSKARGGDLGTISRTDQNIDQTFLSAAFALRPGQISGIVTTQFGFHIIKVDSKTTKTFAQAHAQLEQQVTGQKQTQAFQEYLVRRVRASNIVVNPRYGDFNPETIQIEPHQFFVPASPEPTTQLLPQP